jgi:membrane protein
LLAQAAEAGRTLRDDVRVVVAQFGRQDIFFHAGSVAYSALLAGVPFVLLLASALGYVVGSTGQASNDTILRFLSELLPERTAEAAAPIVRGILIDVEAKRTALGLVGAPLFAWFSTRMFGALRASLTSVFDVQRGHGFFRGKMLDLWYVTVGTVLVTVYLAFIAYLALGAQAGALRELLNLDRETISVIEFIVGQVAAISFLGVMFASLYKFLPNRPVAWESAGWGALWGVGLFEITRSVIFEFVTRVMNPASLYSGTLAAIVVVVFWAYYAAVVFLIGGVVARVHEVRRSRA